LKPLVKNSADEAQVKRAGNVEKFRLDEASEDLRFVMSTPRGRRFMHSLLGKSGLLKRAFSENAIAMSRAEGRREIGIELMEAIDEACPEQYFVMMKEAKKEEENNA
jgi:hypothetical protein